MNNFYVASILILFFSACVHTPIAQTPSAAVNGNTLAILQTSGGFAGVDEVLTVFKDGKLDFTDNRRNLHNEARVKPEQLTKLRELISKPEYQQLRLPSLSRRGADYFTYRISTWSGDGKEQTVTATDLDLPDILSQVISELNTLRRLVP